MAGREKEREWGLRKRIKTEGEREGMGAIKGRGSDKIKVYALERKRKGLGFEDGV